MFFQTIEYQRIQHSTISRLLNRIKERFRQLKSSDTVLRIDPSRRDVSIKTKVLVRMVPRIHGVDMQKRHSTNDNGNRTKNKNFY